MYDGGKPTNPKDASGVKKAPLHCIPCQPLYELGLAMLEGSRKYGSHNYRSIGVRASVYYDAAMRHLMAWWEGENIDPDSGLHHIIKAAACIFVLRDSMLMGNCDDDRPIRHKNGLDFQKLSDTATDIIEKYPDCAEPFLEKSNEESIPGYGGDVVTENKSCWTCKYEKNFVDMEPCSLSCCFNRENWEPKNGQ